jgi:glucosamine-6-phosphate deaminase
MGDDTFTYAPSKWVPFRDVEAIRRCRAIKRSEIEKHRNPDFQIRVVKDADVEPIWVTDMVARISRAAAEGRRLVMILPNPCPTYRHVARLINALRIDCRNLWAFAMDEYADQDGRIAPAGWPMGFTYAMKHNLLYQIDESLRPPERQFVGFTNANINDYAKMIADAGGADICYSGPGWTGHLAFIEPDAPEFDAPLEQWRTFDARIVTLSPFTLAQNSLHGSFGMSGDLAAVPPKAATIGPAQVIASRERIEISGITVHGTATAWQRLIARLCYHGPVTPKLPTSIHQELRTDAYISETIARDIEPDWDKGY